MIRRHTLPQISMPVNRLPVQKTGLTYITKLFFIWRSIPGICYNRRHLSRQSHWTLSASETFPRAAQCGIIEFFTEMKVEFAKQLIRENQLNFTQISDFLGYSSIHYFSRQFKKVTGMTPSNIPLP